LQEYWTQERAGETKARARTDNWESLEKPIGSDSSVELEDCCEGNIEGKPKEGMRDISLLRRSLSM
jgi:hypothetical protein